MRVPTPRSRLALTAVAVGVSALSIGLVATANAATARPADTGARGGDVVGVGSDTLQNAADFIFDNSYNNIGNSNRIFNYYATGDANGRATYDGTCGNDTGTANNIPSTVCNTGNTKAVGVDSDANPLASTVILRAGQMPVVRPNGSGGGILALIQDAPGGGTTYEGLPDGSIQYARASRLPGIPGSSNNEEGLCTTSNACGGLHVYQFATDTLQIAHVTSGYDGPTGLSLTDLNKIYQCQITTWGAVPGYTGTTPNATIHPLIPQSGSGTRNFFLADLATVNNNVTPTPGTCVRTVEEHDPDGIYQDTSPADAVEPFSTGKLSLINSGYFTNGNVNVSNGLDNHSPFTPNYLTSDPGTATADGTAGTAYSKSRGLYFVVRQEDEASTTPFQPGGAFNYIQTLFAGAAPTAANPAGLTPYIETSKAATQIKAAGFTPAYNDCGINPTSC